MSDEASYTVNLQKNELQILNVNDEVQKIAIQPNTRGKTMNTIKYRPSCSSKFVRKSSTYLSAPTIQYRQGKKNKCVKFSLSSVLFYWAEMNKLKYDIAKINYLKNVLIVDINMSNAYGFEMVKEILGMMKRFGWDTRAFSKFKSKKQKKQKLNDDELNNILNPLVYKEPNGSILWGTLDVGVGISSHMIGIYDDWIFDPNQEKALPRTKESLDRCIDITEKGAKFKGFIKLYVFDPKIS